MIVTIILFYLLIFTITFILIWNFAATEEQKKNGEMDVYIALVMSAFWFLILPTFTVIGSIELYKVIRVRIKGLFRKPEE